MKTCGFKLEKRGPGRGFLLFAAICLLVTATLGDALAQTATEDTSDSGNRFNPFSALGSFLDDVMGEPDKSDKPAEASPGGQEAQTAASKSDTGVKALAKGPVSAQRIGLHLPINPRIENILSEHTF